ncbi:hypothetical protein GCM10010112_83470 [Actinoplanes lobatus]|nr:hypothetical protein GCM10010112_83470 [Actinoplanes lobatus]
MHPSAVGQRFEVNIDLDGVRIQRSDCLVTWHGPVVWLSRLAPRAVAFSENGALTRCFVE